MRLRRSRRGVVCKTLSPRLLDLSVPDSRSQRDGPVSTDEQPTADEVRANALMEISNTIVGLYKFRFGRDPSSARSFWLGPDAITCMLEDTFTPAERTLLKQGEHLRVRETRSSMQYANVAEICQPLEHITGRTVRALSSSIDTRLDGLAAETFVFYPARGKKAGHASRSAEPSS